MLDRVIDEQLNIDEEQKESWRVKDDLMADWCLEKLQLMEAEYKRFEMVANERIITLESSLDKEFERYDNERSFFLSKLQEYFETVDAKETKTQMTYKLPSGTLKVKKEQAVIEKDDALLLEYLKRDYPEFVKVIEKPNYAEFKKILMITDDGIVNMKTGELMDVEGLRKGLRPAEFEIKF
ncbi:bacteriophage Mu Gam like protein [Andreesenia angusta]|uniref:Bacteriophage Mu Gam like protein n=1 Tax=Andreesenia angusta TaxID=39480 RepID=A0A1S1V9C5_9FIRM|nr:host-nuclease inhibitor Gam family protein [Andreesenia angusta]OHW63114.1 bacteriophage Mu Gam like protein [Andreesenia angusta]